MYIEEIYVKKASESHTGKTPRHFYLVVFSKMCMRKLKAAKALWYYGSYRAKPSPESR
jgi:hypothetical protein